MTKFLSFFVPPELTLDPPALAPEVRPVPAAEPAHIAPVYNRRARRPKSFTLG